MERARILVVDDEPAMLDNCERLLAREGYACATLADPQQCKERMTETPPDVLIVDLHMPGADGMAVLAASLADDASRPVIVITAFATVASAVGAMREGAFDYLAKPFSAEQLLVAVDRAVRYRKLLVENRTLRAQVTREAAFGEIVGASPAMARLLDQVQRVAPTDANVLISGASGTGKELIARCLHAASPRKDRPFVPVDCAALPEGLLESELFGHERGAFTGAVSRRSGQLVEANGGTVFLDELGEMSPALQAKLLRTLEQRQIRRLGDARLIDLDIRVVAATNIDLEGAVAANRFRQDLYYRVNVVRLRLPPLRERNGDVVLLMNAYLERFARQYQKSVPEVSPEVWETLEGFAWPGNVRELKNLAQRLIVLDQDGRITRSDLPETMRFGGLAAGPEAVPATAEGYGAAEAEALRVFRAGYVKRLLEQHDGNVTQAASSAGVSRRTLHRWLAELRHPAAAEQG